MLAHRVVLFLVFSRDLRTVCLSACTNSHSFSSTPFPAFVVCRFLDEGHSDWCQVVLICIAHCSFDLPCSNNEQC